MFSAFLVACKEKEVVSYEIPKEPLPEAMPMPGSTAGESKAPSASAAAPVAKPSSAGGLAIQWQAPASWQVKQASGFRKGSYGVTAADGQTADVSVITFPQNAGGLLANLNRWRGQAGLEPAATVEDETVSTVMAQEGLPVLLVQLFNADASGDSILGGIVSLDEATWFFKMTGPRPVLQGELENFTALLQSVAK